MGYGSVDDLIGHERALRESASPPQGFTGREGLGSSRCLPSSSLRHREDEVSREPSSLDDSDVLEACQKFSSILLGSSSQVNLYSAVEEKSKWVDFQLIRKDLDNST